MTDEECLRYWPIRGAPIVVNRVLKRILVEIYVVQGWFRYLMCRAFGHRTRVCTYGEIMGGFFGTETGLECSRCGWNREFAAFLIANAAPKALP